MKTTLDIDPALMRRARDEAARRGMTVSDLVAAGLAQMLEAETPAKDEALPPLPTWHGGGPPLVDVADREALERAMTDDADTELPPLPTWHGGEFLVDIANRDELCAALDDD